MVRINNILSYPEYSHIVQRKGNWFSNTQGWLGWGLFATKAGSTAHPQSCELFHKTERQQTTQTIFLAGMYPSQRERRVRKRKTNKNKRVMFSCTGWWRRRGWLTGSEGLGHWEWGAVWDEAEGLLSLSSNGGSAPGWSSLSKGPINIGLPRAGRAEGLMGRRGESTSELFGLNAQIPTGDEDTFHQNIWSLFTFHFIPIILQYYSHIHTNFHNLL